MRWLRTFFRDPLVGLLALLALVTVVSIIWSAVRQSRRDRAYRRFIESKRRPRNG
jgi:hypothetical protein